MGKKRASHLGVQMLIVFKDRKKQYKVLTIKRSQTVASYPGFIQFVPSGGFEIFGNSDEHTKKELISNFSVKHALFREYLEELHGQKECEKEEGGETLESINNDFAIREIQSLIDDGKAEFVFLGSTINLCGLRHELSFALVIHDEVFADNVFKSNHESKTIERYTFNDIEEIEDKAKVNPTSAALWKMFTDTELYKKLRLEDTL